MLYECRASGYTEKGKQVELTGLYWIVGWVCRRIAVFVHHLKGLVERAGTYVCMYVQYYIHHIRLSVLNRLKQRAVRV